MSKHSNMRTLKYLTISVILTGLFYIVFASEMDTVDFREWTLTTKVLFVLATIAVDLVLIDSHRRTEADAK